MIKSTCLVLLGLLGPTIAPTPAAAADPDSAGNSSAPNYALRYVFQPGQTLRWEVVHRSAVHTAVSGTTQVAETVSKSVKVWRVKEAAADGTATFEHLVENVDMRQKLTGRDAVHYNSQTDKHPPAGFENLADSIGVPLSVVTMDPKGKILSRQRVPLKAGAKTEGQMTIPLPEEPVPVGHTWSFAYDIDATLPGGFVKRIKVLQKFTLQDVKTGVATIGVLTQILTPIHDPAIEAQLIQCESAGTVRFDVDAGRVIEQQMDADKRVVGFRGEASSIHYLTRFTEKLLPSEARTASRPQPGDSESKK